MWRARRPGRRQHAHRSLLLGRLRGRGRVEPGLVREPAPELVGGSQGLGLAPGGERPDQQRVGAVARGSSAAAARRRPPARGRPRRPRPTASRCASQSSVRSRGARRGRRAGGRGATSANSSSATPRHAPAARQRAFGGAGLGHVEQRRAGRGGSRCRRAPAGRRPGRGAARQARDVAVEGATARVGRLGGPGVEQPVGAHHPAPGHGEQGEHRPPATPAPRPACPRPPGATGRAGRCAPARRRPRRPVRHPLRSSPPVLRARSPDLSCTARQAACNSRATGGPDDFRTDHRLPT